MLSMGRRGGSEAEGKPQQTLALPEWTWGCPSGQATARSLATLRSRTMLVVSSVTQAWPSALPPQLQYNCMVLVLSKGD